MAPMNLRHLIENLKQEISKSPSTEDDSMKVSKAVLYLPPNRQQTKYSCGPAALVSVLNYFGIDTTEEKMVAATGADSKNGASIENLIKTIISNGLGVVKQTDMTYEELSQAIHNKNPVIVAYQAWFKHPTPSDLSRYSNDYKDGHYSVVIGVDSKRVYLQDPSQDEGWSYIPKKEFMHRWHDKDAKDRKLEKTGLVVFGNGHKGTIEHKHFKKTK